MLHASTLQLLRFHFSLFLLPVYLFAISQAPVLNTTAALLSFVVLHLLVYPASNGYNSYMDRDQTPIGGLQNPLQPTRQLFYVTLIMDGVALLLSLSISWLFALCILFYILASRAYSYRGIRLKRFALAGFVTVFVCQGALIFFAVYTATMRPGADAVNPWAALAASCLIGASYPLTQIYQHEADAADGVITLSYKLGKRGTFVFSLLLFVTATACLYRLLGASNFFWLFLLCTFPVVVYFLFWMRCVWRQPAAANFKNSLRMNLISTLCLLIYFSTLFILKHVE